MNKIPIGTVKELINSGRAKFFLDNFIQFEYENSSFAWCEITEREIEIFGLTGFLQMDVFVHLNQNHKFGGKKASLRNDGVVVYTV